jgi:hypothetical protein
MMCSNLNTQRDYMKYLVTFAVLFVFLICSCSKSPQDKIVGTYQMKERDNKLSNIIQVTKTDKSYSLKSVTTSGAWEQKFYETSTVTKEDLESLLKSKIDFDFYAIESRKIGIVAVVPKGSTIEKHTCETGYIFISMFGVIDLYKI